MDFEDQLPCGGYQKQDKQIKQAMENLSLNLEKQQKQKCCQNKICNNCSCECKVSSQNQKLTQKSTMKQEKNKQKRNTPLCKKCKQNNSVLMHKNQAICKACLHKNIQYKCRLNLQNKIKIKGDQSVLICFSGGLNSIALVNIMKNLKLRYKKHPLFGQIKCIYIQQQPKIPQGYLETFKEFTEIDLQIIPIYQVFQKQQLRIKEFQSLNQLLKCFKQTANTFDLLEIFRNRLIRSYAQKNNYTHILKANNCQNLATQVFKSFTKGKGGNITDLSSYQIGESFAYPLRQHLQKQLQYYFYSQKLSILSLKSQDDDLSYLVSKSLDNHLISFIQNLQNMYSHTSPAIVRTSQKLQSNRVNQKHCKWCEDRGVNQDIGICLRCQRIKQSMKTNANLNCLPQWMK